jgi:uncharacterized Zn finger protein
MSLLSGRCPVCGGPSDFIRSRQSDELALECLECGSAVPVRRAVDDGRARARLTAELEAVFDALLMLDQRPC